MVFGLLKSLYGVREAPKIWYTLVSSKLNAAGLSELINTYSVFRIENIIVECYLNYMKPIILKRKVYIN